MGAIDDHNANTHYAAYEHDELDDTANEAYHDLHDHDQKDNWGYNQCVLAMLKLDSSFLHSRAWKYEKKL